jgi:hypothetical protein
MTEIPLGLSSQWGLVQWTTGLRASVSVERRVKASGSVERRVQASVSVERRSVRTIQRLLKGGARRHQ